jgi:hypothetical protein
MKVEVTILEDQLALLQKFHNLPKMVEEYMGILPQSFPTRGEEIERIKELCEDMEHHCKKWIFSTMITNTALEKLFEGYRAHKKAGTWDE